MRQVQVFQLRLDSISGRKHGKNTRPKCHYNDVIDMSKTDDELCHVDTTAISNYVLLLLELGEYGYTYIDALLLYYIIDSEWKIWINICN